MVALWMSYATLVAALFAVGAWAADRALTRLGRARRWAWAAAVAGGLALPAIAAWQALRRPATAPPAKAVFVLAPPDAGPRAGTSRGVTVPPGVVASMVAYPPAKLGAAVALRGRAEAWAVVRARRAMAALASLDRPLLGAWLLASTLSVGGVARGAWALRRRRRTWREADVAGARVWLAPSVGPAVVGALRPRVVLPEWAAVALGDEELRLVLAHERAHAAARDPLLLALALGVIVVVPWNAALWVAVRRLRLAAEADCDRRVLRAHPDARRYARLLVTVAERAVTGAGRGVGQAGPVAAALLDPPGLLERRVEWLLAAGRPGAGRGTAQAACVAAGAAAAVACAVPAPRLAPNVVAAGRAPCALEAACADGTAAVTDAAAVRMAAAAAHINAELARIDVEAARMNAAGVAAAEMNRVARAMPDAASSLATARSTALRAQVDSIGSASRAADTTLYAQVQAASDASSRAMLSVTATQRIRAQLDSMRVRVDQMQRLIDQSARARAAADSSFRAAQAELARMRTALPALGGAVTSVVPLAELALKQSTPPATPMQVTPMPAWVHTSPIASLFLRSSRAPAPAADPPSADELRAMVTRYAPQAANGQLGTNRTVWLLVDSTNRVLRAVAERDDPRTGTPSPNSQGMRRAFPELRPYRWLRAGSVQWILPGDTLQVIWASPRYESRTEP